MGGLGFRDLHWFNLPLLMKQLWRFLMNPHTLCFKIMKASYFRRTSLCEAKHGYDPSYIWSSLWSVLGLFKEGLGRSIGDGRDTMVWKDKWVFDNELYISLQKPPSADDGLTIYDLMHEGEQRWNVEKISGLLGHVTPSVLAIPLSQHAAKDGYF
uniref:Uncharacterized protein n=1 Tax=Chenopodium quinoa TaxID=63459 RepID=A0A803N6G4_CHEQI